MFSGHNLTQLGGKSNQRTGMERLYRDRLRRWESVFGIGIRIGVQRTDSDSIP